MAAWCLFREGRFGIGRSNTSQAKNCILHGSPVVLKVDDTLYLVSVPEGRLKDRLADFAGRTVTVRGIINTPPRGQPSIAVVDVEPAKPARHRQNSLHSLHAVATPLL